MGRVAELWSNHKSHAGPIKALTRRWVTNRGFTEKFAWNLKQSTTRVTNA